MLKSSRIAVAGFLFGISTLSHSFEIIEAKTILVPYKGKMMRAVQVCKPEGCYIVVKEADWIKQTGKDPFIKQTNFKAKTESFPAPKEQVFLPPGMACLFGMVSHLLNYRNT